jgi:hypothetical protein
MTWAFVYTIVQQLFYLAKYCRNFLSQIIPSSIVSTFYPCYTAIQGLKIFKIIWKFFFGVTCPFWLSLLFSFFFCHQVVHLIHLVFRRTRELNPRPRTMVQTVSPSPLDQGASLLIWKFNQLYS